MIADIASLSLAMTALSELSELLSELEQLAGAFMALPSGRAALGRDVPRQRKVGWIRTIKACWRKEPPDRLFNQAMQGQDPPHPLT
jgi:hypothetical protein